jgi:hypothetical protein
MYEQFLYLDFSVIRSVLNSIFDGTITSTVESLMRTLRDKDARLTVDKSTTSYGSAPPDLYGRTERPHPSNPAGQMRYPLSMLNTYLVKYLSRLESTYPGIIYSLMHVFHLLYRISFCRYAPAKSYLLVWAKTFAMYHNMPNDEAKEVVSKYMLKMHNLPESKTTNAVYGMPLVPWDDNNIPNIYHMIENSPKGMKIDSPSKHVMEVREAC